MTPQSGRPAMGDMNLCAARKQSRNFQSRLPVMWVVTGSGNNIKNEKILYRQDLGNV